MFLLFWIGKKYIGEYMQAIDCFEKSISKTAIQKEYKQGGQELLSFMELKVLRELGDCYQEVKKNAGCTEDIFKTSRIP